MDVNIGASRVEACLHVQHKQKSKSTNAWLVLAFVLISFAR